MKLKVKVESKNPRLNPVLIIAILVGVAAAVGSYAFTVNQGKKTETGCQVDHCVSLTAEGARPDELSVKIGSVVQFNSADGQSHSLSLGKGGEEHSHSGPFNSGEFQADEAWRATFKEPGTFFFHDHHNPGINILVVAYDSDSDNNIE